MLIGQSTLIARYTGPRRDFCVGVLMGLLGRAGRILVQTYRPLFSARLWSQFGFVRSSYGTQVIPSSELRHVVDMGKYPLNHAVKKVP